MFKLKHLFLLVVIFFASLSFAEYRKGSVSLRGGLAQANLAIIGKADLVLAYLKVSAGADYWLNSHFALGGDIGMGGEGYSKAIGITNNSILNLKTGSFYLDPGFVVTGKLDPKQNFVPYGSFRLGLPMISGKNIGFSVMPRVGTLVYFNKWAALDLAFDISFVANFKFNYMATIFSLGSIGLRINI